MKRPFPLVMTSAPSDTGPPGVVWGKYVSRSLDMRDGIGAVIGQNFNPQFPDIVHLITRHAEGPTTYKAVVVWRHRKFDRETPGPGFILIR